MGSKIGPAHFLLEHRDDIEYQCDHRRALDHLNQPHVSEVLQKRGKDQRTADHADQQHQVEQCYNTGTGVFCRKVRSERQTRGLRNMHAQPSKQEGCHRGSGAQKRRTGVWLGHQNQGEGQKSEATKLHHGACPEKWNATPAKVRAVVVRPISDQCARRRHQKGNRQH